MVEVFKPSEYDATVTKLEDYITVSEFAERVGVSVQAIHKAIKAGRIKGHKRFGYVFLINKNEAGLFKKDR